MELKELNYTHTVHIYEMMHRYVNIITDKVEQMT